VDGQEVAILSSSQEEIRFSNAAGEIRCTPEQLWRGLVGDDPTVAEAGSLLAQCLAHWMALQRVTQVFQRLEPSLVLPSYRLSPFVAQALATLDGTPEQAEAVARVLRMPVQAVLSWAQQQTHCLSEKVVEADADRIAAQARETRECEQGSSAANGGDGQEKQFRWSRLRLAQLSAFLSSTPASPIDSQSAAVAKHFGWPVAAVRAKLESMQSEAPVVPARRSHARERADSSSEDE
jgi:hypothetical protein